MKRPAIAAVGLALLVGSALMWLLVSGIHAAPGMTERVSVDSAGGLL